MPFALKCSDPADPGEDRIVPEVDIPLHKIPAWELSFHHLERFYLRIYCKKFDILVSLGSSSY